MTKALFSRCWSNCPHKSRGPGWSCPYIISAGASEEFDRRILRTVRREIGGEAGLIGLRNSEPNNGRGAIDAVKEYQKCNFQTAVAFLQANAGKEPAKEKTPARDASSPSGTADGAAAEHSSSQGSVETEAAKAGNLRLKPLTAQYHKFAVPSPWLEARCSDKAIRERYGVFCYNNPRSAWSGRVMLTVKDLEGVLYGYLGRHTRSARRRRGTAAHAFSSRAEGRRRRSGVSG